MKFTLKNRPKYPRATKNSSVDSRLIFHSIETDQWIEGFEKELRLRIENLEWVLEESDTWGQSRLKFMKEILGE